MKIVAIIPAKTGGQAKYHVEATENELHKLRGVAGKAITGRYKVGHTINLGAAYNKLKWLSDNVIKLRSITGTLRDSADSIETQLPED